MDEKTTTSIDITISESEKQALSNQGIINEGQFGEGTGEDSPISYDNYVEPTEYRQGHTQGGTSYVGTGWNTINQGDLRDLLYQGHEDIDYSQRDSVTTGNNLKEIQENALNAGQDIDSYLHSFDSAAAAANSVTDTSGFGTASFGTYTADQLKVLDNHATEVMSGSLNISALNATEQAAFRGSSGVISFSPNQQLAMSQHEVWKLDVQSKQEYLTNTTNRFCGEYARVENEVRNAIAHPSILTEKISCSSDLENAIRSGGSLNTAEQKELNSLVLNRFENNEGNMREAVLGTKAYSQMSGKNEGYDALHQDDNGHSRRVQGARNLAYRGSQYGTDDIVSKSLGKAVRTTRKRLEQADNLINTHLDFRARRLERRVNNGRIRTRRGETAESLNQKAILARERANARANRSNARRTNRHLSGRNGRDGLYDSEEKLAQARFQGRRLRQQERLQRQGNRRAAGRRVGRNVRDTSVRDAQRLERQQARINRRKQNASQNAEDKGNRRHFNFYTRLSNRFRQITNSRFGRALNTVLHPVQTILRPIKEALHNLLLKILPYILPPLGMALLILVSMDALLMLCVAVFGSGDSDEPITGENGFYSQPYQDIMDSLFQYEYDFISERQEDATNLAKKAAKKSEYQVLDNAEPKVENAQIRSIVNEYGEQKTDMGIYCQVMYMAKIRIKQALGMDYIKPVTNYVTALWLGKEDDEYIKGLAVETLKAKCPTTWEKYDDYLTGENHQLFVNEDESTYLRDVTSDFSSEDQSYLTWHNGELKGDVDGDTIYSYAFINHQNLNGEESIDLCNNAKYHIVPTDGNEYSDEYGTTVSYVMFNGEKTEGNTPEELNCDNSRVISTTSEPVYEETTRSQQNENGEMEEVVVQEYKGQKVTYTWVCYGHCGGHITPYLDFWYVEDAENLCKCDDFENGDLYPVSEKARKWISTGWNKVKNAFKNFFIEIATGEDMSEITELTITVENDSFKSWNDEGKTKEESWHDNENVKVLEDLIGTRETGYAEGVKNAKDLDITIIQGRSAIGLTTTDISNLMAEIETINGDIDGNLKTGIEYALSQVGKVTYSYGYHDCSWFISEVVNAMGYNIGRQTTAYFGGISNYGTSSETLKAGTILLARQTGSTSRQNANHVMMCLGQNSDGTYIIVDNNASDGGTAVHNRTAEWLAEKYPYYTNAYAK